jgi:IS5 family transposase
MSGPAIAQQLGMPVSTVGAILRRLGLGKLAALAPKPMVIRYERQSQRRILDGQAVKATEKLVRLFEPHADIIVKGNRDVRYGYKLNLVTGRSGLILDVVVETGNPPMPSASCRCSTARSPVAACRRVRSPPMAVMRAITISRPRRAASRMSPSTRRGLAVEDRAAGVYRKLRNFRAGIEAGISCPKHAF